MATLEYILNIMLPNNEFSVSRGEGKTAKIKEGKKLVGSLNYGTKSAKFHLPYDKAASTPGLRQLLTYLETESYHVDFD